MKTCDACGKQVLKSTTMGAAVICQECAPDIQAKLKNIRGEGKSANAMAIARAKLRQEHSAGTYNLRDIPADLWSDAKHLAIDRGISLRELIFVALRKYIEQSKK